MGKIRTILVTKTELQDIQETILKLLNSFPELPEQIKKDGIYLEQIKPKNSGLCLSTVSNPYKIRTDIDGSYVSRYQFMLMLQTMDIANAERIHSQAVLSKIGEWLEGRTILGENAESYEMGEYPKMQCGRVITRLYKNTLPKLVQRLASNIEVTQARFTAEYYVPNDL